MYLIRRRGQRHNHQPKGSDPKGVPTGSLR
jgi:hypothetical protein